MEEKLLLRRSCTRSDPFCLDLGGERGDDHHRRGGRRGGACGSGLSPAPRCAPKGLCHPARSALDQRKTSQDQRHAAVGGGSYRGAGGTSGGPEALEGGEAPSRRAHGPGGVALSVPDLLVDLIPRPCRC